MNIPAWIYVVYAINTIFAIVVVFFQRRDPVVSMAWVMCFTLLPLVGLLMFLVFGQGLKSRSKYVYNQKRQYGEEMSKLIDSQREFFGDEKIREVPGVNILSYFANNGYVLTVNNSIQTIYSAAEKYDMLLKDIENAKESINILYFIIRSDGIGNRLIDALIKKSEQGVRVRLLYDTLGCFTTNKKIFRRLKKSGAEVTSFFSKDFVSLSRINHRNHRKIVVIDNEIAYMGGMNIGDEYEGKSKTTPWRDTHMRITGDAVRLIYKYFCLDWDFSTNDTLTEQLEKNFVPKETKLGPDYLPVQIVTSGPDSTDDIIKNGMIKMIMDANRHVCIQSPYFVPDKAFLTAIEIAAKSGVDVKIMLPGVPDKNYVSYTTNSYIGELLEAGARVYMYNGFIHAKTITADDEMATIGTTNIDIRSFQLHFEMNAFVYSGVFAKEQREQFERDMENSTEITMEIYNKRGLKKMFKEGFYRLFSPVM